MKLPQSRLRDKIGERVTHRQLGWLKFLIRAASSGEFKFKLNMFILL